MAKWIFLPLGLIGLLIGALAGYQWAKASVAQEIYQDRLAGLEADYQQLGNQYNQLAEQYNQAVTPLPVTELLVEDGIVCVAVRMGDGELKRFPTPFNAWENELHVDYALIDGRLLIRRVYDELHAPSSPEAVLIDPDLLQIQWDSPGAGHGQVIYRNRMADGRWVVTVTRNGALDLQHVDDNAQINLVTRPQMMEFEPAQQHEQPQTNVTEIGFGDVWRYLTD